MVHPLTRERCSRHSERVQNEPFATGITEVRSGNQRFIIRAEQGSTPQGAAMLSATASMVHAVLTLIRRDRSWHLRVRRYSDDPMGPVIYEEVVASKREMKQRLSALRESIASGREPWASGSS